MKKLFTLLTFLTGLALLMPLQSANAYEDLSYGERNAPVTIEVFDDYQCPFCARLQETMSSTEIQNLVSNGKVKLVFKDFPLAFHTNAKKAAQAINAVYEIDPDQGMDMRQKLYDNQSRLGTSTPDQLLEDYAVEVGISRAEFQKHYPAQANITEIEADIAEGSRRGVSGTPSYFINGVKYSGAQPLNSVLTQIDKALNNPSNEPSAGFENEVITAPELNSPFHDTTPGLAETAAVYLYEKGILGGFPDGSFRGDRFVNRAEAAKFLILASGTNPVARDSKNPFRDVLTSEWYGKFVLRAAELKIINGYKDGNFKPGQSIQRDEFLAMLSRTFGVPTGLDHNYLDKSNNPSAWYWEYAGIANKYDLVPGESFLNPNQKMTREEFAIALYQYLINR